MCWNKNRSSKVSRKVFPAVSHSVEDHWLRTPRICILILPGDYQFPLKTII